MRSLWPVKGGVAIAERRRRRSCGRRRGVDTSRPLREYFPAELEAFDDLAGPMRLSCWVWLPTRTARHDCPAPASPGRFVELAATCPPELKTAHDGKGVLKEAARKVIPSAVIDRPRLLRIARI